METINRGTLEKIVAGGKKLAVACLVLTAVESAYHPDVVQNLYYRARGIEVGHIVNHKYAGETVISFSDDHGHVSKTLLIYSFKGSDEANEVFEVLGTAKHYTDIMGLPVDKWYHYVDKWHYRDNVYKEPNDLLIDNNVHPMTDEEQETYTAVLHLNR